MRLIQTIIIFITFLCFLIDAATIPEEHRNQSPDDTQGKRLAPRGNPRRPRKTGNRKKKKDDGPPKYFHEPGGSELGNHYDTRYYGGIQDYADRQDTQLHMLRAYLTFFNDHHIESWLAHGTLLGWWWNGKMLPWDWDIDTQVSGSTLKYLGEHYNHTHYDYVSQNDPPIKRTYLLDVNPASLERERGNGNNIIDARWIDTTNGLYIDITGLSETHPEDQPGVWVCKNYHRYHTTDLYPMRDTMYEGVIAKVPYAYDLILGQEYGSKAMVLTDYQGYVLLLIWPCTLHLARGLAWLCPSFVFVFELWLSVHVLTGIIDLGTAGIQSSKSGSRSPTPSSKKKGKKRRRPTR